MSACMSNKFQAQGLSASLRMDEETMLVQKQGIITILSSDWERNRGPAPSLRRTLSADMSSKKWLSQNASSPMKKTASSEQLLHFKIIADSSSSSEGEDDYEERKNLEAEAEAERERFEIWSSIQRDKKEKQERAGQFDTWSSIISQKANEETSKSLPPYIHPIVQRSKSTLSEKSLEICTESLGSETGSDGFSSSPPSETEDAEEDKEEEQEQQQPEKVTEPAYEPEEELQVPKYNYAAASKKSPPRSFPPPLPSLSRQDGPSLHMRPHRDNGRLVLEALSVPSQNNFCVRRQDGRLVLTFANHHDYEESKEDADEVAEKEERDHVEELEEEFGGLEEDDQEEKEHEVDEDDEPEEDEVGETETDAGDVETVIEKAPLLSSGITSVHRLALVMNKPIGLVNRNPKWSEKLNQVGNLEDVKVVEPSSVAQSLPPRPRVARLIPSAPAVASAAAAAASFNAYEYHWRTKSTAKGAPVPNPLTHQQQNYNSPLKNNSSSKLIVSGDINPISNKQQQLLVLRGKNGDYLVHNLKSCKDSRRSFLFWEPYCIATS